MLRNVSKTNEFASALDTATMVIKELVGILLEAYQPPRITSFIFSKVSLSNVPKIEVAFLEIVMVYIMCFDSGIILSHCHDWFIENSFGIGSLCPIADPSSVYNFLIFPGMRFIQSVAAVVHSVCGALQVKIL